MDPAIIVEDTEQTRFCPQRDRRSDGQGETSIPPPPLTLLSGGILNTKGHLVWKNNPWRGIVHRLQYPIDQRINPNNTIHFGISQKSNLHNLSARSNTGIVLSSFGFIYLLVDNLAWQDQSITESGTGWFNQGIVAEIPKMIFQHQKQAKYPSSL